MQLAGLDSFDESMKKVIRESTLAVLESSASSLGEHLSVVAEDELAIIHIIAGGSRKRKRRHLHLHISKSAIFSEGKGMTHPLRK